MRRLKASQLRLQLYLLLMLIDQLSLFAGFLGATLLRSEQWMAPSGIKLIYLVSPLYLMMALMSDAYSRESLVESGRSIKRGMYALSVTTAVVLSAMFFFGAQKEVSRVGVSVNLGISAIAIALARRLFYDLVRVRISTNLISELVIVDDVDVDAHLYDKDHCIDVATSGLTANVDDPLIMHQLGLIFSHYDRVIVYCTEARRDDWALVLKGANVTGEIVQPGLRELGAIAIGSFGNDDTLVVARGPLSLPSRAQKRALDILITVPTLIILLPVFVLIALAIKLDSPGPIFFKQRRIGRGNRMFNIYKFRSMRAEMTDSRGNRSASRDDDRITRVGRLIRSTSIDELPQLFNVLLSDMSLVGPRPHALGSLAGDQLFWEVDREYWCRHALKPGITGLAQVRGFRGATHHRNDLQKRLEADLEYLVGWTLMRDIAILLSTFKVILHRNAY